MPRATAMNFSNHTKTYQHFRTSLDHLFRYLQTLHTSRLPCQWRVVSSSRVPFQDLVLLLSQLSQFSQESQSHFSSQCIAVTSAGEILFCLFGGPLYSEFISDQINSSASKVNQISNYSWRLPSQNLNLCKTSERSWIGHSFFKLDGKSVRILLSSYSYTRVPCPPCFPASLGHRKRQKMANAKTGHETWESSMGVAKGID